MADDVESSRLDSICAETTSPTDFSSDHAEIAVLSQWDRDIRRAARYGARRLVSVGTEADDLAQEARIRLLTLARAFPHAPVNYVRVVIANAIRAAALPEARRLITASPEAEYLEDDPPPCEPSPADERAAEVAEWATMLPQPLRNLYDLLYREGRTQREVAKILGVSQPRVAQLHRRLLDLARNDLIDEER